MTMTKTVWAALAAVGALAGCSSANSYLAEKYETVEMYHIVDFKTAVNADTIIKAAVTGLGENTNSIQQARPLMMDKSLPATAGRFHLVDLSSAFNGTQMEALMQMGSAQAGGVPLRTVKCDGAVWTAHATRNISGYNNLNLYNCLYAYHGGYQLDIYAVFQKSSGGALGFTKDITDSLAGTPEAWVNKTILSTIHAMQTAARAHVTYLEGQPQLDLNAPAVSASK